MDENRHDEQPIGPNRRSFLKKSTLGVGSLYGISFCLPKANASTWGQNATDCQLSANAFANMYIHESSVVMTATQAFRENFYRTSSDCAYAISSWANSWYFPSVECAGPGFEDMRDLLISECCI